MVARSIFELKMSFQLPAKDFAILYRTNAQSRALEEALRKLNIPYRIYGGLSFYRRKEIKDILAYFRLVINNYDEDALRRCINYPARGIGDSSIEKAIVKASELGRYRGRYVNLIGYQITQKQVMTKGGQSMSFVSFEDETALYETVLFPDLYQRFYPLLSTLWPLVVFGLVQDDQGALVVEVQHLRKVGS